MRLLIKVLVHQTGASRVQELADMYLAVGEREGMTGPGAKLSDADINAIQGRHNNYIFVTYPYASPDTSYEALPESDYMRLESCTWASTTVASGNCLTNGNNYNSAHAWAQHHSSNDYHDWWNSGDSPGVGSMGGANTDGYGPSYMLWAQ